jgi:hypothetical protein
VSAVGVADSRPTLQAIDMDTASAIVERLPADLPAAAAAVGRVAQAQFMALHDGRIHFHGTASELRDSQDVYLREFLFRTLPPW